MDFVTGISKEVVSEEAFKIFPVPTQGQLTIELPIEMSGANYRIIDMTGRILKEGHASIGSEVLELDVRNIQAGIYIFGAYDTKRVLFRRFIKN